MTMIIIVKRRDCRGRRDKREKQGKSGNTGEQNPRGFQGPSGKDGSNGIDGTNDVNRVQESFKIPGPKNLSGLCAYANIATKNETSLEKLYFILLSCNDDVLRGYLLAC